MTKAEDPVEAPQRLFDVLFDLALGLLLFGDYLALTASRLATGATGNWLWFSAALQLVALAFAVLARRPIPRIPLSVLSGYAGLCAIASAHVVPAWLAGNSVDAYVGQKAAATFALLGPSLLLGAIAGTSESVPGARWFPLFSGALALSAIAAVSLDPALLTVEHYDDPPVFLGFFAMPAHQPLAFCLSKAALFCFAAAQMRGKSRALHGAAVGVLAGLTLLTGARSYALALAAALAILGFARGRKLGALLAAFAIGVFVFQTWAAELVLNRFDSTQVFESVAYAERQQAWSSAIDLFLEHPLAGVGPGAFAEQAGFQGRVYPHNLVLEVLAEFGLSGAVCLLLMLAPVLWSTATLALGIERRTEARVFAAGLLLFGLIGAMAVGDLIRNHFVFFAIGMAATSTAATRRPAVRPRVEPAPAGALS
ncbi:MAG: hypothetical protein Fur0037_27220 [Planctomycetota bacterium]